MKIERKFTHSAVDYQQMFVHNSSDVTITDINGEVNLLQRTLNIHEWSNNAVTIAASKYFYGNIGDNTRETSVFSMVERVINQITEWGIMQNTLMMPKKLKFSPRAWFYMFKSNGCV